MYMRDVWWDQLISHSKPAGQIQRCTCETYGEISSSRTLNQQDKYKDVHARRMVRSARLAISPIRVTSHFYFAVSYRYLYEKIHTASLCMAKWADLRTSYHMKHSPKGSGLVWWRIVLILYVYGIVGKARWADLSISHQPHQAWAFRRVLYVVTCPEISPSRHTRRCCMYFLVRGHYVVTRGEISSPYQRCRVHFLVRISIWSGKIKLFSEAYVRECETGWSHHTSRSESQQHECEMGWSHHTSRSMSARRVVCISYHNNRSAHSSRHTTLPCWVDVPRLSPLSAATVVFNPFY